METDTRLKLLTRLAQSETVPAREALEKVLQGEQAVLNTDTQYDRLQDALDIVRVVGFRFPESAVATLIAFVRSIEERTLTYSEQDEAFIDSVKKYRNAESLIIKTIEVLLYLRYLDIPSILHALLELARHPAPNVSKKSNEGLTTLARYNIRVFYGAEGEPGLGAAPQKRIIEELEKLDEAAIRENYPAIVTLLSSLLSEEMEGTSWSYDSLTISRASTPSIADVPDIRSRSIALTKRLYRLASNVRESLHVISVLTNATRTPVVKSDETRKMYTQNTCIVLEFFKQLVATADFQVLQKIEHNSYWVFYHAGDRPEVIRAAQAIEDAIAQNSEYQIFRSLVGFEGIFGSFQHVKDREFDPTAIDNLRKQNAQNYISRITEQTFPEWRARILKFSEVESDDLATFPIFYEFLNHFAIEKPELAFRLITEDSENLERFIIPLFRGLWGSSKKPLFLEWLESRIEQGLYLYPAAKQFLATADLEINLLKSIFRKAVELGDLRTIRELVSVVISHHGKDKISLIENLLVPALEHLTKHNDANWVFDAWFRKEIEELIDSLGEREIDLILQNLSVLNKVDYQAERILAVVAKRSPEKVLSLLLDRLHRKNRDSSKDAARFEAIPFELHDLNKPLSKIPQFAVQSVKDQYDGNYGMLIHGGARLLKIIFPEFPSEFEAELMSLIKEGGEANLEFVLAVLRNYEGQLFIHPIAKEVARSISSDSSLRNDLALALESAGVVRGEFGMAEAYERKKSEVADWLNDENENVREFAKQYMADLQAMSDTERKRAQEQIELRKFQYGERE